MISKSEAFISYYSTFSKRFNALDPLEYIQWARSCFTRNRAGLGIACKLCEECYYVALCKYWEENGA